MSVMQDVATVRSQLLLSRARHCIGHKWSMDQMCSKGEKKKNVFHTTF